jgi:hypothetical protein
VTPPLSPSGFVGVGWIGNQPAGARGARVAAEQLAAILAPYRIVRCPELQEAARLLGHGCWPRPARASVPDFRTRNVRNGIYRGAMTDTDYPWEPPFAGTEAEHLIGALDRLRTTFRWKTDDLDAAGLQARIGASSLTLAGLLKHLAAEEDYIFTTKLSGQPVGAPWDATGWMAGTSELITAGLTECLVLVSVVSVRR